MGRRSDCSCHRFARIAVDASPGRRIDLQRGTARVCRTCRAADEEVAESTHSANEHRGRCSDQSAPSPIWSPRSTRSLASGAIARLRPPARPKRSRERWSFLDGPITANNPMGVHHAWGRSYKERVSSGSGRCRAAISATRTASTARVVGRGQRREGPGLHQQARHRGLRHRRVRQPLQAARPDLRRAQTEQSIRLGMWMDWNDPHELRRLRDRLAEDPSQQVTIRSTSGADVTDTAEMLVGRLGMPSWAAATSPSPTRTTS